MAVKVRRFLDQANKADSDVVEKNSGKRTYGKLSEIYTVSGIHDQVDALTASESGGLSIPSEGDYYTKMDGTTQVTDLVVISKTAELLRTKNGTNEGLWRVTVQYDNPERNTPPSQDGSDIGKISYVWGGTTGNEHISSVTSPSKRLTWDYDDGLSNKDGNTGTTVMINDSGDDVKGVDILTPKWSLVIKKIYAIEDVTPDFLKGISSLVGLLNDAPFPYGGPYQNAYQAKDLFLASINVVDDSEFNEFKTASVQFNFMGNFKRPVEDITLYKVDTDGSIISQPVRVEKVDGFTYKWLKTEKLYDPNATDSKPEKILPTQVHIDTVYHTGDFSKMNLWD